MSEAEEQAWQKHKSEWPLEVDVLPLNHEFAFRTGYRSAPIVSLPDRDSLITKFRQLGMAPIHELLRQKVLEEWADAVISHLSLQPAAEPTDEIPEADATPDEAFDLGRVSGYDEAMHEIGQAAAEVEWGIDYGDDNDEPRRCSEEMARKRASKEFGDKIVHRTVIPRSVGPWIEDAS